MKFTPEQCRNKTSDSLEYLRIFEANVKAFEAKVGRAATRTEREEMYDEVCVMQHEDFLTQEEWIY